MVVNGLGKDDARGEAAVKAWCEGFGEVRGVERREADGALVVRWRSDSVADLVRIWIGRCSDGDMAADFARVFFCVKVCRLHAQVYIQGVGSVALSWIDGKRKY